MQRARARDAGRQLAEEHPGVVFDLLQLLEELGILHAETVAKRGAGRSRRGRKCASPIHDTGESLPEPDFRNSSIAAGR